MELGIEGAEVMTPFNIAHAWAVLDDEHRRGVLEWLRHPFFP